MCESADVTATSSFSNVTSKGTHAALKWPRMQRNSFCEFSTWEKLNLTESSQASREPSSCCEGFSTTERRRLQSEAESSFQKWAGMSASAGTVRHQGTAEKPQSSRNLQEVQGVAEGWCTATFSDEANFCSGNLEKSFVCGKSWDLWGTFTGLACLKHGA